MNIIDNINSLLGDDLKASVKGNARIKIAASCFSIYAYESLKTELSKIESLEFIFTAPTFVANEVTDKIHKERREFFIPKAHREHSLYGSEFEIQLRNQLTQRAIARECAKWIRDKATFRSNKTKASIRQFLCVNNGDEQLAMRRCTAPPLTSAINPAMRFPIWSIALTKACILKHRISSTKSGTIRQDSGRDRCDMRPY